MYKAEMEQSETEDSSAAVCSIADENGIIFKFSSDFHAAEKLALLLNKLSVERCHVTEIAEDFFCT